MPLSNNTTHNISSAAMEKGRMCENGPALFTNDKQSFLMCSYILISGSILDCSLVLLPLVSGIPGAWLLLCQPHWIQL